MTSNTFSPSDASAPGELPFFLGDALEREARLYLSERNLAAPKPTRTHIVADFEYRWRREDFANYLRAEGSDVRAEPLWPFHEIVAGSWLVMRFRAGEAVPEFAPPVVMAADTASEQVIVEALFAALAAEPCATCVTWGGETKDLAVLRRCAAS